MEMSFELKKAIRIINGLIDSMLTSDDFNEESYRIELARRFVKDIKEQYDDE